MTNKDSRSGNFSRNAVFAACSELMTVLLNFAVRYFFVRSLNVEYLGVRGLFSSILTILSMAELGVGTAIVYSMYQPLAVGDQEKIKSLVAFYKKAYSIIGTVVFVLGLALIPAFDFFIKEAPWISRGELLQIYVLTVFQTASTYFFSYKYSIFNANQQGYIVQKWSIATSIVCSLGQILILVFLRNYLLYLVVSIVSSLLMNILLSIAAERTYPYLKDQAEKLDRESTAQIKQNTVAMLFYKVGQVTATTIDTLLISRFFGLASVGLYSNYHLIISYSDKLFSSVLGTITPSLGNLMAGKDRFKQNQVFSALQLVYYWLSTYLAVGLVVLFNPLIELVFGKDYLFDKNFVIALVVSITLTNFQRPCSLIRDASGLFWYGKFRPLLMSILNVAYSLAAIHFWGIIGVVIGTALAKLNTYVWYDPYIVFKHALAGKLSEYFKTYILHWGLLVLLSAGCELLFNLMNVSGLLGLVLGALMITIVVNSIYYMIYRRSKSFGYVLKLINNVMGTRSRFSRNV